MGVRRRGERNFFAEFSFIRVRLKKAMKLALKMVARLGIGVLGIGILGVPGFGEDTAQVGTVNYIEGSVALEGRQLNAHNVGSVEMTPGEVLETGTGKAEILLTPGVFVRLGDNSALKMISPSLTPTQVEVERGRAGVEVDEIYPQNDLEIVVGGVTTQLVKTGYYEFDATHPTVLVYKGKAAVEEGPGKYKEVKDHHSMALVQGATVKAVNFDERDAEGPLYNWSSLRSQYLAEANNQIAGQYAGVAGFYPGWYWDPYVWGYTFIGMDPYWSPFGFGFYPPWGWYGGAWYGRGFYGRGYAGGGWGGRGYAGGGFHGGMGGGGFHGGGGGGRR